MQRIMIFAKLLTKKNVSNEKKRWFYWGETNKYPSSHFVKIDTKERLFAFPLYYAHRVFSKGIVSLPGKKEWVR